MPFVFLALLAAFLCFAADFVLQLAAVDTKRLNLTTLGLALLAAAFLGPVWQANVH